MLKLDGRKYDQSSRKFILKANLRKDVIRDGLMSSKKKTLIPSAAAVMNHYILMFLYPPVDWNQRQ